MMPAPLTITRRAVVRSTITIGLAGLLPAIAKGNAAPTGSPVASPASGGFAHDGILIAVNAMPSEGVPLALMEPDAFNAGHIPGSRALTWEHLTISDSSDAALATWRQEMLAKLNDLGVTLGIPTLAYDDGTFFAARIWWVLTWLGFDPPQVLDGGLAAWKTSGGEIERAMRATVPVRPVGIGTPAPVATPTPRPEFLATKAHVLASVGDPDVLFLDVRSAKEYAAGHIPGAINLAYTENATGADPNVWKMPSALRAMYDRAGVIPGKQVVPYCSTGTRSAVTAFTLWLLGYPDVALFTGSWQEWTSGTPGPITTGSNP
jgi:thiosulfate/3-mercaptopyruvate sulfurtransferase